MPPSREDEDEDEDEEEELRRDWEERVATGRPLLTYDFDLPIAFRLDQDGQLEMDCQCFVVGTFSPPATIRIRLAPPAVHQLRHILTRLENLNEEQDHLGCEQCD